MKRLINFSIVVMILLGLIQGTVATASTAYSILWEQLRIGGGTYSSPVTGIRAEDFSLTAAATISQVEYWNSSSTPPSSIDIVFYRNTEQNVPGTVISSEAITDAVTEFEAITGAPQQYRTTLTLTYPVALDPGRYWVAIYASDTDIEWAFGSPSSLPGSASKIGEQAWQRLEGTDLAFRLLGTQETCPMSVVVANNNDSGAGSLRQAITDVCAGGTITFDESLSNQTITLTQGHIHIGKSLTIEGPGAHLLAISGGEYEPDYDNYYASIGGVFKVYGFYGDGGVEEIEVNISGLTIRDGRAREGGGVYNHSRSTLVMTDCVIGPNNVVTESGGGLSNRYGNVTLNRCTVEGNHGTGSIGGAGISGADGVTTLINTTVSGNVTNNHGGGIFVGYNSTLNLIHTTITKNIANQDYEDYPWGGAGGIYVEGGVVNIHNSIVAGNIDLTGLVDSANPYFHEAWPDVYGAFTSQGGNLIGDGTGSSGWIVDDDQLGTASAVINPMLDPLALNEPGTTPTFALQSGSTAINAVGCLLDEGGDYVVDHDQRGVTRPQPEGGACDIGAFEYVPESLPYLEAMDSFGRTSANNPVTPIWIGLSAMSDVDSNDLCPVINWEITDNPIYGELGTISPSSYCYRESGTAYHYASVQYTPNETYAGSDSFTFTVSLGAATDTGTVTITPNQPPLAPDVTVTKQGWDYGYIYIDIPPDPDGDDLYYGELHQEDKTNGTISWGGIDCYDPESYCGISFYYTPPTSLPTEEAATLNFTYRIYDGIDDSNWGTVTVLVGNVPEARNFNMLAANNADTLVTLGGWSEGTTPLTFKIIDPPAHGTLLGEPTILACETYLGWDEWEIECSSTVHYRPDDSGFTGVDQFTYIVNNGVIDSLPATVLLNVQEGFASTAYNAIVPVTSAEPIRIKLTVSDPNIELILNEWGEPNYLVDKLSFSVVSEPTGTFEDYFIDDCFYSDAGQICEIIGDYTLPEGSFTGDSFTFKVNDGSFDSNIATVTFIPRTEPKTLWVNVVDDDVDDACDASHCSLREAVQVSIPGDVIEFGSIFTDPQIIYLQQGPLLINNDLVINGTGAQKLTISGNERSSVILLHGFYLTTGEIVPINVTISGVTVKDGRAHDGGGIYKRGNVTLVMNDCVIGPNNIVTIAGGGIANRGGDLTLNRCTVVGNHGTGSWGGAGVFAYREGVTTLINSTVTDNVTNNLGGGILAAYGATVKLIHSTVTANTANQDFADDAWGGGGGIYIVPDDYDYPGGTVIIHNSIVAGNTDLTGLVDPSDYAYHVAWPDVYGTVTDLGGNLIGDGTGSTGWVDTDLVGTATETINPLLGPLMLNAPGSTPTFALLKGSPAIDAVDCIEGIDRDQRGAIRPQGFGCDIGAYEVGDEFVDLIPPELTITGATADGTDMSGDLATGYILETTNDPAIDHLIQFKTGTEANEALKAEYFGLYLSASTVSAADLKTYYDARGVTDPFLTYLKDAVDGTKPFVYIKGDGTTAVSLVDAAKHDLVPTDVDMTVPDDFPLGTYTVAGDIEDLAGNKTTITLILIVSDKGQTLIGESQLTTARAKCSEFASGNAPDLPRLMYTFTTNKKTLEEVIKSVTPSTFLYYVKATLPTGTSTLVIAQENDQSFPAMGASVTLYDETCARLSPQLASVSIVNGNITIDFVASETERVIYAAVKYSAKPIIGQIVTGWPTIEYAFSAALNGSEPFTSADLEVIYLQ